MRDISTFLKLLESFLWGHWYPCFRLHVMSTLGVKARVDPFLCAFLPVWSSDSPLALHLLTVKRSAWQPSLFNQHTCRCVHNYWWRFSLGIKPTIIKHSAVYTWPSTARLCFYLLIRYKTEQLFCQRAIRMKFFTPWYLPMSANLRPAISNIQVCSISTNLSLLFLWLLVWRG